MERFVPRSLATTGIAALLALGACTHPAAPQNNAAAPLIVDGNFDEANFVVPDDEGAGDETAAPPADNAATAHGNRARPR